MKNDLFLPGFAFLFLALLVITCKNHRLQPDITDIKTNIHIDRLEQDLFSIDPALCRNYIRPWQDKYGEFFNHFCMMTGLGNPDDAEFPEKLAAYISDLNNYRLYKRTMEVFPDLGDLTRELNQTFSRYRFYFPERTVPRICTFISGFTRSAITDDSLLAIGLDRYLGAGEPWYRESGMFSYLTEKMYPSKILSDCLNFWGETEFIFNDSVNNLIAHMIYKGRLLYFTSVLLPGQPDSLTLGFSNRDLGYLKTSEKSIWAYLVEHKLLFNSDRLTINKFIQEGPFTADFGRESPARASVWIGYRITESFMDRNKDITLSELMEETDYLSILNRSGYNP